MSEQEACQQNTNNPIILPIMLFIYRLQTVMIAAMLSAIFFTTIYPLPAAAKEPNQPREEALKLQKLYSGLGSLSFDFQQVTRSGSRARSGSGNAAFAKMIEQDKTTSIMRWNYTDPDKQVIINDGQTLSIYTEKDKQLIKTSSRELESDITYAFFTGTRDLLEDFYAEPGENGFVFSTARMLKTIRLVPRQPHNQIKAVQLWFDDEGVIHHMMIEDHFESVTELNFENIAINYIPVVNREELKKITTFKVPPGTEIITQ